MIIVFNKIDKVSSEEVKQICKRYDGIGISAINKETLIPLIDEIKKKALGRKNYL
jgi:GTP-binding protein HflX